MPEITVTDLVLDYEGARAVDSISFTVAEGEFLTLLGPSGCGKTTTLMSIAGLAEPTGGSITCGEETFFDHTRRVTLPPERRDCGVVFQSYAIWPHLTVLDNVAYPLKVRRVEKSERVERAHEALRLVEMEHLASRYPHELSGGQQQRVALARAVVYSPRVLLLDEPLSNLDAKLREQARAWLKQIQSRLGLTTVFVTHDQDEALSMSDRIVVMNNGRIEQIGTPEEVYASPDSPFVADFLGSSNLLPCQILDAPVASTAEGQAQTRLVKLEDGTLLKATLAPGLTDRAEDQVMVRPEAIEISDDLSRGGEVNRCIARVTSEMFLGAHYRYLVEVAGSTMTVDSDRRVTAERVLLHLPSEACRVFATSASRVRRIDTDPGLALPDQLAGV